MPGWEQSWPWLLPLSPLFQHRGLRISLIHFHSGVCVPRAPPSAPRITSSGAPKFLTLPKFELAAARLCLAERLFFALDSSSRLARSHTLQPQDPPLLAAEGAGCLPLSAKVR